MIAPALGQVLAPEISVGRRLRLLREERGLSIRALASRCDLAMNTLRLIENDKTSPSVSTLQRLARGLDVPITAFFEDDRQSSVIHIKAGQRPRVVISQGILENLGAGFSLRAVQPFVVTLEPLGGSGSQVCAHAGYEFVYCLKGRLAYTIEDRTYLLEPDDSLLFESHLPHRWQNVDEVVSKNLLVLYPTREGDHPTEQHFMHGGMRR